MKLSGTDRAALCNVVLLGFFALGLGLSLLVVNFRTAIVLSQPVELNGEGITVSLPAGTGWQSLPNWTYEQDNSFTLVSVFKIQDRSIAEVRWQLQLAQRPLPAEELLAHYAARFSGQAGEMQRFESSVSFVWMYLFPRAAQEELLLALCPLDSNRVLLLQIRCYAEPLYIRELFEFLAASVAVNPDPRRAEGIRMVQELAQKIQTDGTINPAAPLSYLIRAADGTPLGYSRITPADSGPDETLPAAFDVTTVLRERNGAGRTVQEFRAAPDLSEFIWNTTRLARRKADQASLHRQPDGTLKIQDSYGRRESYWPAPAAVPEILLPAMARQLMEDSAPEILIDLIASNGSIVPTALRVINPQEAAVKVDDTRYAVKVDFLHHEDNYEEYYFDAELNPLGKYESFPAQAPRLWIRTTEKELLFHFGNLFDAPPKSASLIGGPERLVARPMDALIRQKGSPNG